MASSNQTASATSERAMAQNEIHVVVNGEPCRTRALTLADLVVEQGFDARKIATAVNGGFVPARSRGACQLSADDRIEILSARQGG